MGATPLSHNFSECDVSLEEDAETTDVNLESDLPTCTVTSTKDNFVVLHLSQRHDVYPSFHRKTDVIMPLACRVEIRIVDHLFLVCVDSGATFSLLSQWAYNVVKEHCRLLNKTKQKLHAASGTSLGVLGRSIVHFWISDMHYDFNMLKTSF